MTPLARNPKLRSATALSPTPDTPSTSKSVPASASTTGQAPTIPAAAANITASTGGSGSQTTISLTGTGTSYSKAEGPIDAKFKEKREVVGTYQGIKVWGPIDPPGQLGIWGQEDRKSVV